VPRARDDDALHVVGDEPHRVRDVLAEARLAADRQDGHTEPTGRALRVLCDRRVERPVEPEAAAQ
jgi:hypothetical protein